MATRISEDDLEEVVEVDPLLPTAAFIRGASRIVDRVVACAIEKEEPLTDGEAFEIELWLAGHMYLHRDREYTSKSTLNASGSFNVTSSHLEIAKLLDHSGCLAELAEEEGRAVARGFWLGRRPSEQTDYDQRD